MSIRMTVIHHTGRSRTIEATSLHEGGPLHLSRPVPTGSVLCPASIADAQKIIAHMEETIALMTPLKRQPKSAPNRNTAFMEKANAEK